MRKFLTLTAAAALALAFGFSGAALANHAGDPAKYADSVDNSGRNGQLFSNPPHAASPELNVLGAPDAGCAQFGWFNLGNETGDETADAADQGFIIVRFDNNVLLPGSGGDNDLAVWDACAVGALANNLAEVSVSDDGITFVTLGNTTVNGGATNFDIEATGLPFIRFVKIRNTGDPLSGADANGYDADAVEALNSFNLGTANIVKSPTSPTNIEIQSKGGFDGQQFYTFDITITNSEGEDLTDIVFEDVLPAEFDLDPEPEDDAFGDPFPAGDCADGACDGVKVTGGTNPGKCTATGAEHTNKGKSGKPFKLQPDIITITADTLGAAESCVISVWAMTDQKAALDNNKKVHWTPTECNEDTFIFLNEGVEVIDTMGTEETNDDVTLLIDDDQIELTCIGP